jgi:hypothetical protein
VDKDYEPGPDEVVVNGFSYHLTRKPKTDGDGNITERLDKGEVLDGQKFRIVDPPWLGGRKGGTKEGEPVQAAPTLSKPTPKEPETTSKPVEKPSSEPSEEPEPATVVQEAKPEAKPEPVIKAEDIPDPTAPPPTTSNGKLELRIEKLNKQTISQMVRFIWECGLRSGPILHVMDPMGETLVAPELNLHVDKDALISRLREYNLLCPE